MAIEKSAQSTKEVPKKSRGHGVPVPVIPLRKAIELMNKVWEKEKRNAAPVPAVMAHWEYGLKSSGGFQAIASLKRFGLLDEEGSNEKRTLKLTSMALELLKNSTIDLKEYTRLLKQAALHPKAHQELWDKYGAELPSDQTLESHLVFDKNFSEDAAKAFISVYKDTIEFAKLQKGDTVEDTKERDSEGDDTNATPEVLKTPLNPTPPSLAIEPKPPAKPLPYQMTDAAKYLTIPTDAGDAAIPMGMSLRDFDLFKKALDLFRRKIVGQTIFPVSAIWRNKDVDKPVLITAEIGEENGVKYFQSQDGTGIPETELTFT